MSRHARPLDIEHAGAIDRESKALDAELVALLRVRAPRQRRHDWYQHYPPSGHRIYRTPSCAPYTRRVGRLGRAVIRVSVAALACAWPSHADAGGVLFDNGVSGGGLTQVASDGSCLS